MTGEVIPAIDIKHIDISQDMSHLERHNISQNISFKHILFQKKMDFQQALCVQVAFQKT